MFLGAPFQPRVGWKAVGGAPLVQMVWQGSDLPEADSPIPILKLGAKDSVDMIELTAVTKPGPFVPRTHELGSFFGIRIDSKPAAMAGERLKVDGYTEVSAVCTHPLHSRANNRRAIALYERLCFRHREASYFVVLERNEGVLFLI